ncbi:hypothetical protein R6Q59_022710 [Mikania micrantha]|uniref:Cell wall hydroxyproline-rich glycoprotein n=1 Tax=Mikania micrantha TaxID=192012 RepID=A0A5N6MYM2_9ASTR|nr:hypothetical protein E3N88_27738 [Mikania micrantha]
MKALCCFLLLSLFTIASSRSLSDSLKSAFASTFTSHNIVKTKETDPDQPDDVEINVDARLNFPNPRLKKAYYALQEWKKVIHSDPDKMLQNWEGIDVCSYNGVFCAKAPDDPTLMTVAGIDLNHCDIAGQLVPHLGLLTDLGIFHINSNRFCGIIPNSFSNLKILHEFDISNNRFVGPFPNVVLQMHKLKYLDIRYNNFEGVLPPQLFDMNLDAIFLNHNRFCSVIPENIGNSSASVIVLANNDFKGCIPKTIGQMSRLDEVIFADNELSGCLPDEFGLLEKITVLDLSKNNFVGTIPESFGKLKCVEMIDVRKNELIGTVVEGVCTLPKLLNFTFSGNYFNGLDAKCENPVKPEIVLDYRENCLPEKSDQRSEKKCSPVVNRPIDCESVGCKKMVDSDEESKKRKPPKRKTKPKPKPPPPVKPPPLPVPEPPKSKSPPVPKPVKPPPPVVYFPPPPPPSPASPPPVPTQPPPSPVPSPPPFDDIDLPPDIGSRYASPPPPMFPGY